MLAFVYFFLSICCVAFSSFCGIKNMLYPIDNIRSLDEIQNKQTVYWCDGGIFVNNLTLSWWLLWIVSVLPFSCGHIHHLQALSNDKNLPSTSGLFFFLLFAFWSTNLIGWLTNFYDTFSFVFRMCCWLMFSNDPTSVKF